MYDYDVAIVQSTCKPANDHLMELLLLSDTVRRAGSRRIIAVIPYFGYSRQDRPSYRHGPISSSLVASLLEAAGVDRVITLDLHSSQSEGFFSIGVQNLDPLPLFIPIFFNRPNCIVVSPDVGGLRRAQRFSDALQVDLAAINKSRGPTGECHMSQVIGDIVGKYCILIDDLIDTGSTLCKAAALLKAKGAIGVSACVTHAVLSADAIANVESSVLERLYVTDSIVHSNLSSKIHVMSMDSLFIDALKLFSP